MRAWPAGSGAARTARHRLRRADRRKRGAGVGARPHRQEEQGWGGGARLPRDGRAEAPVRPRHAMSDEEPSAPEGKKSGTIKRSRARLAAVQALYQIDLNDAPTETVIDELRERGQDEEGFGPADDTLFTDIVRGTIANRDDLDGMLNEALAPDWVVPRLEAVLRAVLRGGAYELQARLEIPSVSYARLTLP